MVEFPSRRAGRSRGAWTEKLPRHNTAIARAMLACAAAIVEVIVVINSGLLIEALYHVFAYGESRLTPPNLVLCSLVALLFVLSNAMRGEYRIAVYLAQKGHSIRLLSIWTTSVSLALAFGFFSRITGDSSRAGLVLFYVIGYLVVYATRRGLVYLACDVRTARGLMERRGFLIGYEQNIDAFTRRFQRANSNVNIIGAIGLRENPEVLEDDLALAAAAARMLRPDDVFILVPWSQTRVIDRCVTAFLRVPAQIHLGPERVLDRFVDARIDKIGSISSLSLGGHSRNAAEILAKRAFDIVFASLGLLILSPLLLVVPVCIRLDSKGPALFLQRRYGFNREPFRIYKFRSMTTMDDGRNITQATVGDSRVTRVGRVIRRYNIDELPQLINVLRGEMSLVGPRPHALAHDQLFERKIALYARRHNVKPGITGWAQVNGLRGEIDTPQKIRLRVKHDLYYINNWSLLFDAWIVILTLFSKKAYRNAV